MCDAYVLIVNMTTSVNLTKEQKLSSNANASVLVLSPLNNIIEEQVNELNDLGLPSVQLKENDADCLKATSEGKFRFIFCSAERCLSEKFKNLLKAEQTRPDIEMVVVDESHTVARSRILSSYFNQLFFTHILEHFIKSLAFMRPTG